MLAKQNKVVYHLENINKEVNDGKKRKIVDNISLSIYEEDFCGIIGKSGSGKSTLLNILGGIDQISDGNMYFYGKRMSEKNKKELAYFRRDIGFVFQSFQLIDHLSIFENVALPLRLSKTNSHEVERRVFNSLKDSSFISEENSQDWRRRLNNSPKNLSGGEKQRVAIARALVNNPKVILADEPTGSLDSNNQEVIMALLLDIHKTRRNTTVVLVSHSSEIIERCPRIIKIEDGRLLP
jgi:ABC-type lipoprotein export system ATPase subunit